nr:hypothetical protein [Tanacetum cinerariifolium]
MGLPFISGSDHLVAGSEYQGLATKEELKGFNDEEILDDGEDMDCDQPDAPEESSQPPPQNEDNWAKNEEVIASYVDLKALSLTQRDLKENFMTLLWNLGPRLTKIKGTHDIIQFHIGTLKTDTSNIKAMITKMVFNGTSSSTPLGSILLPTAAPSEVNAPVGGFIKPKTIVLEVPITVSSSTPKLTDPLLEVTPFETGSSSFITPKSNKGNVIDKETDSLPPKLSILDKKEKMELAAKNAELSKDELMKAAAKIVNEVGG